MFGVHFCFLSVTEIPFHRVATWSTFGIRPDLESQSEFSNFQILSRWHLKAPDSAFDCHRASCRQDCHTAKATEPHGANTMKKEVADKKSNFLAFNQICSDLH